jgi:protein involved in polysaccharide export with SLBB domain
MNIKKLSILFFLLVSCLNINSQDIAGLDADYLESLPEEVRKDVLSEIESNKEKNKITRKPSFSLKKNRVIQDWENFLQQNYELDTERYGIKMFRSMQSTFMPINEPNFDSSYILDTGDILELQVISNNSYKEELYVARDGSVTLKDIGKIYLSGKSLKQASNIISTRVKESIVGASSNLTLTSVRDIQILITGNVSFPGMYTLSGNSHLLQAINIAGGVNENGSLRSIEVRGKDKPVKNIDLYELLILGQHNYTDNLRSGDVIYVNPVKNLVRLGDGFNKTGLFELKDNETFNELFKISNGVNKNVINKIFTLNRYEDGIFKNYSYTKEEISKIKIQNLDSIYVENYKNKVVELLGEVVRPGKYQISSQDDIYSLIQRAGGYTKSAYPFAGQLYKDKAKDAERELIEKNYYDLIRFISASITNNMSPVSTDLIQFLLDELREYEPLGRVSAEFDIDKLYLDPSLDIILEHNDKLYIPKFDKNIYVYGEVQRVGSFKYQENMSVNDYISSSGGLTSFSDSTSIIVISPNGESFEAKLGFLNKNSVIYPGSTIFVPRKIVYRDSLALASIISPIFSSIALSIASLNSINK